MDQLLNRVFRHYQIQALLGRKTGRRTFLATDLETRSPVVIKLLLFNPDFTWEDLKLFQREAETLQSLDHPAIPKYLDCFEVELEFGKGFALVQSYIEARSLQEWVQSGRTFSEAELKAIANELLNILDYLHRRQPPVIHRDIKPSNVLLGDRSGNSSGQVYLVDFGSVQTGAQGSNGSTMTIVGTYGYMPLEQFGGQTVPASDLYALGATLIYGATGYHPDQFPQKEMRILFADRVTLSSTLVDWLQWLIEPSLELRLKSAQQALETLENSICEPVSAIANQPTYSRITVKNTRQTLEILIPPKFSIFNQIATLAGGSIMTSIGVGICSSALQANHWLPALLIFCFGGIFLASGLGVFLGFLCLLADQKLCITPQQILLIYQIFGVRFLPGQSAPRSAIARLERIRLRYKQDSEGNIIAVPPCLNIWAGTERFRLGSNSYESVSRLTEQELDWLAQLLSHRLNLPVTTPTARSTNPANPQNSISPAITTELDSIHSASQDLSNHPIHPNQSTKLRRPANAICVFKRDEKSIEIITPPAPFQALKTFSRIMWTGLLLEGMFLPVWFLLIQKMAEWEVGLLLPDLNPSLVILLLIIILLSGFTPLFLAVYWFFRTRKRHQSINAVSLQIDQYHLWLWEHCQQKNFQHHERRLQTIPRVAIQKLKLVHKKGQKNNYHVGISAISIDNASEKMLLVGNRSFWLSQAEAEWLAEELSIWLKLPIIEVEVVKGDPGQG